MGRQNLQFLSLKFIILWHVRVPSLIIVGSRSDDWILLAARLQYLLITDIHSAIAIQHLQQSLFTTIHTVYVPQSSSPTAHSLNAQLHWRHSQLALTITLCNTLIHYTHWLTSIVFSLLHTHTVVRLPHSHYTACNTIHSRNHDASLADYFNCSRRILKHFSAVLPELHSFPYWHSLTSSLTLTGFRLVCRLI
jgi:hypothetical protein